MKTNITLVIIAAVAVIIGAGCSKDDKIFSRMIVPATTNKLITPREAAAVAETAKYREKANALEQEKMAILVENTNLATNLVALQIENSATKDAANLQNKQFAAQLAALQIENSSIKAAATLQSTMFASQLAALQASNSVFAKLMEEKIASTANQPAPATFVTATAQASVTTPAVGINIPATSGIVTVDNNARIATPGSGTVVQFGTNGMVGGVPCLFNNESTVDRTVTVANSEGYKYTFTVAGSMMETINLLPGKYSYNWTIGKDPATYPTTGQEVTFSVDSKPVHAFRTLGKTFHGGLKFRGEQ
ncbi:MAG: hypothetical protein Q7K35_02810 [bacterium]|nr:hypothetical protein [bacterium]